MFNLKWAFALLLLTACTQPVENPTPTAPSSATTTPTITSPCQPTDQDQYIYHPDRLSVQSPCIRVTGEVLAKIKEADGDFHIRVLLNAEFTNLLTSANQNQCANNDQGVRTCGLLVVEPVCVNSVTQTDAISTCQSNPDPLKDLPLVGQHVWLEGRYVLDMDHGGWAELHPLYRWGND